MGLFSFPPWATPQESRSVGAEPTPEVESELASDPDDVWNPPESVPQRGRSSRSGRMSGDCHTGRPSSGSAGRTSSTATGGRDYVPTPEDGAAGLMLAMIDRAGGDARAVAPVISGPLFSGARRKVADSFLIPLVGTLLVAFAGKLRSGSNGPGVISETIDAEATERDATEVADDDEIFNNV